jgi:hypothetical protein
MERGSDRLFKEETMVVVPNVFVDVRHFHGPGIMGRSYIACPYFLIPS